MDADPWIKEGTTPSLYLWGGAEVKDIHLNASNVSYPTSLGGKNVNAISWFIDSDYQYQAIPTGWDSADTVKGVISPDAYVNFIVRRDDNFGWNDPITQSKDYALSKPEGHTGALNVYVVEKGYEDTGSGHWDKAVLDVFYSVEDLLAAYKLPE